MKTIQISEETFNKLKLISNARGEPVGSTGDSILVWGLDLINEGFHWTLPLKAFKRKVSRIDLRKGDGDDELGDERPAALPPSTTGM